MVNLPGNPVERVIRQNGGRSVNLFSDTDIWLWTAEAPEHFRRQMKNVQFKTETEQWSGRPFCGLP